MRSTLTSVFLIIRLSLGLAAINSWAANPWTIDWKATDGRSGQSPVKLTSTSEKALPIIALAWKAPLENLTFAEQEIGERWVPVTIKNGTVLLTRAAGELRLKGASGQMELTYHLLPGAAELYLSKECREQNFSVTVSLPQNTTFPAALVCQKTGPHLDSVVFSTLGDADWFGSDVFESEGKGERWKKFAYKDLMPLSALNVAWGKGDKKIVAHVKIPDLIKEKVPPPQPKFPFSFEAGTEYLNGTVNDATSSHLIGIQIPLRVRYQRDNSWWLLGAGFDFFVYGTQKVNGESNSTDFLNVWAGAEYHPGPLSLQIHLGYFDRTIDAPGSSITSTLSAPGVGVEMAYGRSQKLGISAYLIETSSGGTFREFDTDVFYKAKVLFHQNFRFFAGTTQVKASDSTTNLTASWWDAGLAIAF